MGNAGLYYYYHTFAKALDAMKLDAVEDAKGVKHYWRVELANELIRRQRPMARGPTRTTAGSKAIRAS